jgi:N-methylhydantoinase A
LYGHLVPGATPQVVTWRLTGRSSTRKHRFAWGDTRVSEKRAAARGRRAVWLPLKRRYGQVPVYDRYSLEPGTRLQGPVILEERESTLVVPIAADVQVLADYTVSITLKEGLR